MTHIPDCPSLTCSLVHTGMVFDVQRGLFGLVMQKYTLDLGRLIVKADKDRTVGGRAGGRAGCALNCFH